MAFLLQPSGPILWTHVPFTEKLKDKGQRSSKIDDASRAVRLYYRIVEETNNDIPSSPACEPKTISKPSPAFTQSEGASWVDELTTLREEIRVRHYSAKTFVSDVLSR